MKNKSYRLEIADGLIKINKKKSIWGSKDEEKYSGI